MTKYLDLDAPRHKKRGRKLKRWLILLTILLVLAGGLLAFSRTPFVQGLLAPVSFFARLLEPTKLTEVDGRVNVLILGLDSRTDGFQGLTDTILVESVSVAEGQPVLVSIPRDFWVKMDCPIALGAKKINAAYNCGGGAYSSGKFDQEKAVSFAKAKVEDVLGIKIPYYAVVNFAGFKEIVDTLDGINVCVEEAFTDNAYPVPGRENSLPVYTRYEVVKFSAGCQTLSGDRALKFARSRHGTANGDFDRARRQQKVIMAVKDKIMSLNLLLNPSKLSQLYQQINAAVKTNAGFGEIRKALELVGKFDDLSQVSSLVLDPASGLVYHPNNSLFGGYVIVPKGGNTYYTKIQAAVQKLFFGTKSGTESGGKP
jgi:LCP family protein required for cell wall assembly